MAKKTPAEVAEKYVRRSTEATTDYLDGVDRVTEAPTHQAATKLDKMKANFIKAIDSGKVKAGLMRVDLTEWKRLTKEKGGARYASGVEAAQGKMEDLMTELLPHIERGQAEIKNMRDTTLEENILRMNKFTRHMAAFKRK